MVTDDESPAETKLIICQNSKPWSRFKKVKMMFQTTTQNPPEQPKAKQLPTQKHRGNETGQGQSCKRRAGTGMTKNCRWWVDQRPGRENLNGSGSSPRLSGPLFPPYLYIPDLLSWTYQKMLYFLDTAVICWFPVATQNVFDVSPANNFSGSFNYLENLNILTVN